MTDGESAARREGSADAKKDWGKWRDYRATVFSGYPDSSLVPCVTCGRPYDMIGSKRPACVGCWEVEHRLDGYLRDGGDAAVEQLVGALSRSGLSVADRLSRAVWS